MTRQNLYKIFDEVDSEWEGDNAFQGLQILSKYTEKLIEGAEHDIIYSCDVDEVAELISEEDAMNLAKLNWFIDKSTDSFACFV